PGQPAPSPIDRVLREGVVVGLANHTALVSRDGEIRPIGDSGAPVRDVAGVVRGSVLVFWDITEAREGERIARRLEAERVARHAAEEGEARLRESEDRYRQQSEQLSIIL